MGVDFDLLATMNPDLTASPVDLNGSGKGRICYFLLQADIHPTGRQGRRQSEEGSQPTSR